MDSFQYRNGILFCEDVSLADIAQQVGTPFYCYSSTHLKARFRAYEKGFGNRKHLICFAVKANSNLAVLSCLASLGAGADIVSGGELYRAVKAGISPEKIVYSGVGKTEEEMAFALEQGIAMFNVESLEELKTLSKVAKGLGKKAPVAFRVNPDVDPKTHPYISTGLKKNKFGLSPEQALDAYKEAATDPNLTVVGIDCHIGSQIVEMDPFLDAFERVKNMVKKLEDMGINLSFVDIGGGLGISYKGENPPSPEEYISAVVDKAQDMPQTIVVEPGRSICGNAGVLVTKILYTKDNGEKEFYIVDAGMNDLGRPSLYDAYHEIRAVKEPSSPGTKQVDVVGPICETGDFLARDRVLPELTSGALLAVMSAGAYGFTMSSNYNSRPRVAEVMVYGDKFHVVRNRESWDDLISLEHIPQEVSC
ncbi:MAG: diaminopimelate decarboxylase [Thermodesulfobacteria bacterium]|nr:diaminopimelate decarboxylase [Thermodesulfobacteriota bacterium]